MLSIHIVTAERLAGLILFYDLFLVFCAIYQQIDHCIFHRLTSINYSILLMGQVLFDNQFYEPR